MVEVSFSVRASELLESILERMESQEALEDVDMDLIDGVLTVEFEDATQLIINRQEALQQIWVASPLGPAHFGYDADAGDWLDDRTGEALYTTLGKALGTKMGMPIDLHD